MFQLKSGIVLVSSKNMENNGESDVIRLPKAAREKYNLNDIFSIDQYNDLCVRSGVLVDMRKASRRGLSLDNVAFVSPSTLAKIKRRLAEKEESSPIVNWTASKNEALMIGSDPEFGLIDDGTFVYASQVMEDGNKQKQVGSDGPCMELRPPPSTAIEDHVKNIKNLITKANNLDVIKKYRWWTGATFVSPDRTYAIGGHVHVGDPSVLDGIDAKTASLAKINKDAIRRRVVRVLDELVASLLTRVDNPDAAGRRKLGYGKFGEWRVQNKRFEWRTPSAVWLTSPNIAAALLGTAKAVSEECYRRMADVKFSETIVSGIAGDPSSFLSMMGCYPDEKVMGVINNSSPSALGDADFHSIVKRLRSMSTYQKYKSYIEALIDIARKRPTMKLDELRENWL